MNRAAWDVDEIPGLGVDRLSARKKSNVALQDIKRFVLALVEVGWRAASGRREAFDDETASVCFRARGQKADPVAGTAIHRAGSGRDILDLILILHGFGSFREVVLLMSDDAVWKVNA